MRKIFAVALCLLVVGVVAIFASWYQWNYGYETYVKGTVLEVTSSAIVISVEERGEADDSPLQVKMTLRFSEELPNSAIFQGNKLVKRAEIEVGQEVSAVYRVTKQDSAPPSYQYYIIKLNLL